MTNTIRAFLVLFFFGLLTACGGGGGNTAASPMMPPMTMTMPDNPGTPPPVTMGVNFDSPEIGAINIVGRGEKSWFIVFSVAAETENTVLFGATEEPFAIRRLTVINYRLDVPPLNDVVLPELNRTVFHATGDLAPLVVVTGTVIIPNFGRAVAFETIPSITAFAQLCPISWLATYANNDLTVPDCPSASGLSYTPNMPNVLHAAMADTFHRGIGIGESRFAFSGRHNGNDRAAGFTYDFDNFALRTDYIRLPSKQDGGVWLDTYRFGILQPINDEARFFAGVDSYKNAILALDVNGDNLHRFGIAAGDGYALQYELQIRL